MVSMTITTSSTNCVTRTSIRTTRITSYWWTIITYTHSACVFSTHTIHTTILVRIMSIAWTRFRFVIITSTRSNYCMWITTAIIWAISWLLCITFTSIGRATCIITVTTSLCVTFTCIRRTARIVTVPTCLSITFTCVRRTTGIWTISTSLCITLTSIWRTTCVRTMSAICVTTTSRTLTRTRP